MNHPSADGGVKHHQQIVADHGNVAVNVPPTPIGFQLLVQAHRTLLTGSAQGELDGHHRHAEDDQEE